MIRRATSLVLVLILLAVGCSSSGDGDESADPQPERTGPEASVLPPAQDGDEQVPAPEAPPENPDDGRLVVQSADNQLSTMLPDGSDVLELTDPGTTNFQAAWAPDGSRVAWVSVDDASGEVSIALDRFDRSDYRSLEVETAPFYLYWDPSSSRIAHLSPDPAGIDLGIADPFAEDGPTSRRIDRGEPYFLSWGPDGDELLVHASGFRLDRIDLGSATIIIDEFPAGFGTPIWFEDGTLMFADLEEDEQFLVTTGSSGEGRRPLVTFEGSLRFAVSNAGNRIVLQATPQALEEDGVVTASFDDASLGGISLVAQEEEPTPTPEFDDSLDAVDPVLPGIPYVMGIFGGEPFPLSDQPALALYPSPDGGSTAWPEAVPGIEGAVIWRIDNNGTSRFSTQPFIPSGESVQAYLPSFDQYNLSHDVWSPSSNLFVFAGRPADSDEPDGIWVMNRNTGTLTRIADGVIASFTRTPSAAGAASSL